MEDCTLKENSRLIDQMLITSLLFVFVNFFLKSLVYIIWQNEVNWLSKIRHQNVIKLLGHCIHGETRFLVYEMMQNGSLESQLHGTIFLSFVV